MVCEVISWVEYEVASRQTATFVGALHGHEVASIVEFT